MGDYADDAIDNGFFEMLNNESDLAQSFDDYDGGDKVIKRERMRAGKCPHCNKKLVRRTNSKTLQTFLGCPNFPKCKFSY